MCVLSLSWNFFVSHDKYIARLSSNVDNLIHRQYNRDWATSYSRPPKDPYLTSPPPVTKSWRRHWCWRSVSGGYKLEGLVGHWPRESPLLCWFQLPQAYFRNPWASHLWRITSGCVSSRRCWVGAFFVFAATQTFSELNFWLGKGISLLLSTGPTAWALSTVQSLKE